MSWISDFLQGIPLNSVLREKLSTSEKRVAELEAKNDVSQAEIDSLQEEIRQLKDELERRSHSELKEIQIDILITLATTKEDGLTAADLQDNLHLSQNAVKHHLSQLASRGYIQKPRYMDIAQVYKILPPGRAFLVDDDLA